MYQVSATQKSGPASPFPSLLQASQSFSLLLSGTVLRPQWAHLTHWTGGKLLTLLLGYFFINLVSWIRLWRGRRSTRLHAWLSVEWERRSRKKPWSSYSLISNLLTPSSCGWSSPVTSGCWMFCFEVITEWVLVRKCSVLLSCMWAHLKSRCLLLKTSQKIPDIGTEVQDWPFLFSRKDFLLAGVGCLGKAGESLWSACKWRSLCSRVIKLLLLTT